MIQILELRTRIGRESEREERIGRESEREESELERVREISK